MTRRRASNTRKLVNPIAYQSVAVSLLTSSSIDAVILLIHTGSGEGKGERGTVRTSVVIHVHISDRTACSSHFVIKQSRNALVLTAHSGLYRLAVHSISSTQRLSQWMSVHLDPTWMEWMEMDANSRPVGTMVEGKGMRRHFGGIVHTIVPPAACRASGMP